MHRQASGLSREVPEYTVPPVLSNSWSFTMHVRWRGLELPARVDFDATTASETFGRFVAEPFERGFGTTIGNGDLV